MKEEYMTYVKRKYGKIVYISVTTYGDLVLEVEYTHKESLPMVRDVSRTAKYFNVEVKTVHISLLAESRVLYFRFLPAENFMEFKGFSK